MPSIRPLSLLAHSATRFLADASGPGTNPLNGNYSPSLPSGPVGTATTTIVDWTMGVVLIVIGLAFFLSAGAAAIGGVTERSGMASRGKLGMVVCLGCAACIGLGWTLIKLFSSLGG